MRVGRMVLLLEPFPGGTFPLCVVDIPGTVTLTDCRATRLSAQLCEETSISGLRVSWLAEFVQGWRCFVLLFYYCVFASLH